MFSFWSPLLSFPFTSFLLNKIVAITLLKGSVLNLFMKPFSLLLELLRSLCWCGFLTAKISVLPWKKFHEIKAAKLLHTCSIVLCSSSQCGGLAQWSCPPYTFAPLSYLDNTRVGQGCSEVRERFPCGVSIV